MPRTKTTPAGPVAKPPGTQSIQRVVGLLRELASHNRTGLRLVDLVQAAGLEQPTVHRMLKSLVAEGLVMQDAQTKRYFLGQALYEFGLAAGQRFGLRTLCEPVLESLARETGDTVFLTVRSGDEAVCLDRREGASPIKIFTLAVGDRRPLGIGAGSLALLAALPDEDVRRVITTQVPRSATLGESNAPALLERVQTTRALGYVLHDVRHFEGVRAVGVAVLDATGQPVAALSLSTLAARLSGELLQERLTSLRQHAKSIEHLLK
ncbi:MAG: IclR family transcriptional regulator [Rhizobacter sp.]|nr:IclR family transcriptional regulator [Rhizobacter sp.]